MTELLRLTERDWLMTRTVSIDADEDGVYVFDADEPTDGDESGTMQVSQYSPELAERVGAALIRAAAMAREADRRQVAMVFPERRVAA